MATRERLLRLIKARDALGAVGRDLGYPPTQPVRDTLSLMIGAYVTLDAVELGKWDFDEPEEQGSAPKEENDG